METSDTSPAEAAPPKPPEKKKESWWDTIRFFLILFIAAVLIRSLIVAPFSIPSGSMLPRLMIGDYLFVAKWPYGYSRYSFPFGLASFSGRIFGSLPERGEVVVFRYPGGSGEDYVKRVIGLPGDTLQMRGGTLFLNGEQVQRHRIADYLMPISPNSPCRSVTAGGVREVQGTDGERYCAYPRFRETLPGGASYEIIDQGVSPGDDTPVYTVPEGHLFMMGDNRDDSMDSRFPREALGVGYLPVENVVGPVMLTFFSTDGSASWLLPWTWFSAARWERIGDSD